MNIGELINSRRRELKLTLEEVGNAVGVSKSTVKKWEDGFISNMRRDKIAELAKVLKISPVSLITGELILPESSHQSGFHLTDHEKAVVIGYRRQPAAVQDAVDRMLGVEPLAAQKEKRA